MARPGSTLGSLLISELRTTSLIVPSVARCSSPPCGVSACLAANSIRSWCWRGRQGSGKSSALKILAGDYFSDAEIIGQHGREVLELTKGVWIFELSELEGLGKRDVSHVKAFCSRTHDKARPAYGYVPVERGRTCIFIGTTNGDYLADESGNRRFWPVATTDIDLDALERDRNQLWAEAAAAEATGETLVIDPAL